MLRSSLTERVGLGCDIDGCGGAGGAGGACFRAEPSVYILLAIMDSSWERSEIVICSTSVPEVSEPESSDPDTHHLQMHAIAASATVWMRRSLNVLTPALANQHRA